VTARAGTGTRDTMMNAEREPRSHAPSINRRSGCSAIPVAYQRLINLYRGGRCEGNIGVHDETTVIVGQIMSPVYYRFIGSTPCNIGW
jgi:hypothetical protein